MPPFTKGPSGHSMPLMQMAAYLGMDLQRDHNLLWIAQCALKEPPSQGWDEVRMADGKSYFVHRESGQTAWRLPSVEKYRQMYERERQPILDQPSQVVEQRRRRSSVGVFQSLAAAMPESPRASLASSSPRESGTGRETPRPRPPGQKEILPEHSAGSSRASRRPPEGRGRKSDYWDSLVPKLTPRGIEKAPTWQRAAIDNARCRLLERDHKAVQVALAKGLPPRAASATVISWTWG